MNPTEHPLPLQVHGQACQRQNGAEEAVRILLRNMGENPEREGIRDTPKRVVKAFAEMTKGYNLKVEDVLKTQFDEDSTNMDEMVILRGIPFTSLCEHHLLPFVGTMDVGYIPQKTTNGVRVVGLSKLARLVDMYACRLQIQERLTGQVTAALMDYVTHVGAAAVCRSVHSCMTCRGVLKSGAEMVTSSMRGIFRDDPKTRAEFLTLCGGSSRGL